MYSTLPHPHLPWMDIWRYGSDLPMVLAGPFGPLYACAVNPMEWVTLFSTYALLPTALASNLMDFQT